MYFQTSIDQRELFSRHSPSSSAILGRFLVSHLNLVMQYCSTLEGPGCLKGDRVLLIAILVSTFCLSLLKIWLRFCLILTLFMERQELGQTPSLETFKLFLGRLEWRRARNI